MLKEHELFDYKEELALEVQQQMNDWRMVYPYVSPFDPCPPITVKFYNTPPQLFIPFQPMNLPQYSPYEALRIGTLWPVFYSLYEPNIHRKQEGREGNHA